MKNKKFKVFTASVQIIICVHINLAQLFAVVHHTAFIICFDNFAIAPSGVRGSTFIWQRVRINSHLYANNITTRIITIY